MLGRFGIAFLYACALVMPGLVRADALEFPVSIAGGPLRTGLKTLESQTGIELLYDGNVVRDLRSPPVVGKLTTEGALQQMLTETDLTVRRASSGAWIIERRTTPPLAQQDAAVAEILVVGRRTQNADIRRIEDDVQPYRVASQQEIASAHRDNIDQFFSSRITSDTSILPSIASQDADVMSSINLRGLGERDTVVLVDGRRMPLLPDAGASFGQSDLNAIPLHAIKRIEVLTGAAGGIHGFGALGGVVNVVLDRDFSGLELFTTQGISSRGDARRHGVEARFGHVFNDGATDFTLFASYQEMDTVRVQDRSFTDRDRRRTLELAPDYYPTEFPHGNSLAVRSPYRIDPTTGEVISNPELTFKPEFGGQALGSSYTYLPLGFSGNPAALTAALQEHAGQRDLSVDGNEARTDLGPNPKSDALLANFRHRFESGWEAYADAVVLRSRGESSGSTESVRLHRYAGTTLMEPESPANPFTDVIEVRYPIVPVESGDRKRIDNTRYTAGVEGALPFDWRGTVEASWGGLHFLDSTADSQPLSGASYYLFGDESDLETNPLGNWNSFNRLIRSDIMRTRFDLDFESRFSTQSLRFAGPVFDTPAGPATLTLLAERRSDRMPANKEIFFIDSDSETSTEESRGDPRARLTRSFYGELRSQLFDESASMAVLRGLEVQLAVRHDEQEDDFPADLAFPGSEILHSEFAGTAYTIGAKITPARWLLLRGSYATGEQPPPTASLVDTEPLTFGPDFTVGPDPRRVGTEIGSEGDVLVYQGGNSKHPVARATTLSLGAVFAPGGQDGPRFALDYSRIRRTRDLQMYDIAEILDHEDAWPERVRRAPLTDADRANGYTGGRLEMIDNRESTDGALEVDAYDLRADWPLSLLDGRLRLYADASYQKRNARTARFRPDQLVAGYRDGPLQRRANGGFDWSKGQLTVGANLQYFGSSLIFSWDSPGFADEETEMVQGARRIPSQNYLDLYAAWRLPTHNLGPVDSFTFDFGVVNALDTSPPREHITFGPGYSRYGDPRMRRFELGLSCQF